MKKKIPVAIRCGYCGTILEADDDFIRAFEKSNSQLGIDYDFELSSCGNCQAPDPWDYIEPMDY